MAQPDGARTKRIPTLSWDSVVESPSAAVASPEPVVDPAPDALVRFEPLQLDPPAEPASSALPIAPPIPTAPAIDDAPTPDEPTVVFLFACLYSEDKALTLFALAFISRRN